MLEAAGTFAPDSTDDPQRMIVECAIFTHYTKADLMPWIQKWRLPVTPADMNAAVAKYRLSDLFAKVDQQYAAEVRSGTVKVDAVKPVDGLP